MGEVFLSWTSHHQHQLKSLNMKALLVTSFFVVLVDTVYGGCSALSSSAIEKKLKPYTELNNKGKPIANSPCWWDLTRNNCGTCKKGGVQCDFPCTSGVRIPKLLRSGVVLEYLTTKRHCQLRELLATGMSTIKNVLYAPSGHLSSVSELRNLILTMNATVSVVKRQTESVMVTTPRACTSPPAALEQAATPRLRDASVTLNIPAMDNSVSLETVQVQLDVL